MEPFGENSRLCPTARGLVTGLSAADPSAPDLAEFRAEPRSADSERPGSVIGRRAAPRLRISLPAQLTAVDKVHTCILINLSRSGARIAILDALREGEGAILRCGVIDHFGIVTRSDGGMNALAFDEQLTDAMVLETRRYQENFHERERRALLETARGWVTGG